MTVMVPPCSYYSVYRAVPIWIHGDEIPVLHSAQTSFELNLGQRRHQTPVGSEIALYCVVDWCLAACADMGHATCLPPWSLWWPWWVKNDGVHEQKKHGGDMGKP